MSRKWRQALLWAAVVLVLTLMPGSDLPTWGWADAIQLDKLVHAGLFGVQTVLLGRAWTSGEGGRSAPPSPFALAVLATIAFGGFIEVMQGLMAMGRHADFADLLADSVGALAGLVFLRRSKGAEV